MIPRHLAAAASVLLGSFTTAGCVSHALSNAIVQAPNQRTVPNILRPKSASQLQRIERTYSAEWTLQLMPPSARLAIAVIEPGDYGLIHSIETTKGENGRGWLWPKSDWTLPPKALPALRQPKATILLLHGFQDAKEDMMHWALYLAQTGYRVVLVDLRGHGRSAGNWIGYGAFEVRDLQQVLDDVQKRGLVAGSIGVLGISYGASIGLELAGNDPRIRSVVAIEPFSEPRRAVVEFAHAVVPGLVKDWTPADFSKAEDRAGQTASFAWPDADVLGSVAKSEAPILYVCAEKDHWVSPENTRLLAEKTRSPHAVMTINFTNAGGAEPHVLLSWTLDPMAPSIVKWLDETLLRPGPDLQERLTKLGLQ